MGWQSNGLRGRHPIARDEMLDADAVLLRRQSVACNGDGQMPVCGTCHEHSVEEFARYAKADLGTTILTISALAKMGLVPD